MIELFISEKIEKEIISLYKSGINITSLAERYYVDSKKIKKILGDLYEPKYVKIPLQPTERLKIIEDFKRGLTNIEIAKKYKRSYITVKRILINAKLIKPHEKEELNVVDIFDFYKYLKVGDRISTGKLKNKQGVIVGIYPHHILIKYKSGYRESLILHDVFLIRKGGCHGLQGNAKEVV